MYNSSRAHSSSLMSRRATWFVSALIALVLVIAVIISNFMLDSTRTQVMTELEYSLSRPVQQKSAALSIWHNALHTEVIRLTTSDMFQLFATEVFDLKDDVAKLVKLSQEQQTSPGDTNIIARLASQLPLLRHQLEQLVERNDILSATLLTADMKPYLGTGVQSLDDASWKARLTDDAWAVARRTFEQGTVQFSLGRRKGKDQLTIIISQPIFAPEYVDRPTKKAVGFLLLTCDATSIIKNISSPRDFKQSGQAGYLLQQTAQGLEIVTPEGVDAPVLLPGWQTDDFGDLPLREYQLPNTDRVYALGYKVPALPWIVVQDELFASVEAEYVSDRNKVLFIIGFGTATILLFIGMLWWWLVGRRERALANELQQLYTRVNQQHQLMQGVNSTMADGIMMVDHSGDILYANEAFATMAQKLCEILVGQNLYKVFSKPVAERIMLHASTVMHQNSAETFSEKFSLPHGKRNFQIAYSPFHQEDKSVTGVVAVFRDLTELVKAQKHAQTMTLQTINVLVRAVEAVDPYLRGQSTYTGLLASHLAQSLHLSIAHVTTVRTAASLSQIGMIQLPRELVNKTSPLTPEERTELERHIDFGQKTLEGIDFGLPVQETIYQMHENFDGSGYPKKLKGEEISLNGRLLGTANTFCALVRPRSYRQEHAVEKALEILSAKPPEYDPAIVDLLRTFLDTAQGKEFLTALQRKEDE